MNEEENSNYDTRSIILQAIAEQGTIRFLESCYVIYEATDNASHAKKTLATLNDEELIRKIKQLEALTEENEHKIYYYEDDEYSPKRLVYKTELEATIRKIRNEHLKLLATTLKDLNESEEFTL